MILSGVGNGRAAGTCAAAGGRLEVAWDWKSTYGKYAIRKQKPRALFENAKVETAPLKLTERRSNLSEGPPASLSLTHFASPVSPPWRRRSFPFSPGFGFPGRRP